MSGKLNGLNEIRGPETGLKKPIVLLLMLTGMMAVFAGALQAQNKPIEPTRTLEGDRAATGVLSVLSEPPGMEVRLNGDAVGVTPIISEKFPAGDHLLRVGGFEIGIRLDAGRATSISWFKGRFIEIPQTDESPSAAAGEPEPAPPAPEPSREQDARRDAVKNPFYWPLNPSGPIY